MSTLQTASLGKPYDDKLKCDKCGCAGEARRTTPIAESPLREWLQPPNGWWVQLNESTLRVRCPDCLDKSERVAKVPTVSSIRPSARREML
jgi:hypothetical protein